MVLGFTRGRARMGVATHFAESADSSWQIAFGAMLYETTCALAGAFPGYTDRGGRIEHAQVRLYEHALTVDEGTPRGFVLEFDRILATDDGDPSDIESAAIRVRYKDGDETRLFHMTPRASRLVLRGGRRAFRLLDEMAALGVPGGPLDDIPADSFVTSWNETSAFSHETMVWHGYASAPLALSGERATCDVFITSKSLVWGRDAQSPISRVPLEMIRDVTPGFGGSRDQQPMAFIGIGDSEADRVEFSFLFDAHDTDDRNALERSAFVVHLRSRNVALAYPERTRQPWSVPLELVTEEPKSLWPDRSIALRQPNRLGERMGDRAAARQEPESQPKSSAAERLRPDRGVVTASEWAGSGTTVSSWVEPTIEAIDFNDDGPLEITPFEASDMMLSEWAPPESPFAPLMTPEPAKDAAGPSVEAAPGAEMPAAVDDLSAYESEALVALADILDVIRRRESGEANARTVKPLPSGAALASVLSGIVAQQESGELEESAATAQRARLLALDDAMRRLDLLLPLHAHGAITTAELASRRDALCTELNSAIFAIGS